VLGHRSRQRLVRLTAIERNLVGARMLMEVVDRPASELSTTTKPRDETIDDGWKLRDVSFAIVRTSRYSTA